MVVGWLLRFEAELGGVLMAWTGYYWIVQDRWSASSAGTFGASHGGDATSLARSLNWIALACP